MISKRFFCFCSAIVLCVTGLSANDNDSTWKIEARDRRDYTGAPVANGVIGILPWSEPFSVKHVILNHVFDRDIAGSEVMRVLKGINPFVLRMEIDGTEVGDSAVSDWKQVIDMRRATHTTSFTIPGKAHVSYEICAFRNLANSGIMRVSVTALDNVSVSFTNSMSVPDGYNKVEKRFRSYRADGKQVNLLRTSAESGTGMQNIAASSMFVFEGQRFALSESGGEQTVAAPIAKGAAVGLSLVGSVCSTRDFADPFKESERQLIYIQHEGVERLFEGHQRLWDELWESDIIIEGDDYAQRIVRSALYNLYSFGRAGTDLSISPMGLSSQGYNGHIFWDSELWMYPPMLFMNREIALSMINYRYDRLDAAKRKADTYGYKGAMFPWESDDSGEECTPTHAITGPFEHHVVADVAIAAWNYYCVTRDREWLRTKGYPLIRECARFWESRVRLNPDGSFSIENVVGADEYAKGVTDNAFTNGAAKKAFQYAVEASSVLGIEAPDAWTKIGEGLLLHFFDDGVTMNYEGYDGRKIKQADVNLLAYPLGVIADPAHIRKDLAYYEDRVDKVKGPAMTFSVFCVQYARLGDAEKAHEMFLRCFEPNMRPPFSVFAETPTSRNPYFATGAGGLLQAVINGFGGLDITSKGIVQRESVLPSHWGKLTITNVGPDKKDYTVVNRR